MGGSKLLINVTLAALILSGCAPATKKEPEPVKPLEMERHEPKPPEKPQPQKPEAGQRGATQGASRAAPEPPPEPEAVGEIPAQETRRVVIEEIQRLADGASMSWKLSPGYYELELTANGDGASVEWLGGRCLGSAETRELATDCQLFNTGQLVISNPTAFGLGDGTIVTVHVVKLEPQ